MNTPIRPPRHVRAEMEIARVPPRVSPAGMEALFAEAAEEALEVAVEDLRNKSLDEYPALDALIAGVHASTAHAVYAVDRSLVTIKQCARQAAERDRVVGADVARDIASWTSARRRVVNVLLGAG